MTIRNPQNHVLIIKAPTLYSLASCRVHHCQAAQARRQLFGLSADFRRGFFSGLILPEPCPRLAATWTGP